MKDIFVELEVLTPVHVGTGDSLDPMSYIMQQERDGLFLHTVDLMAWLADHPDPEGMTAKLDSMAVPAIRRALAEEIDPTIYGCRRACIASGSVFQQYSHKLADKLSLHSLLVSPCITSAHAQNPVLPGSSVKGALRTAMIDLLDQKERLNLKTLRGNDNQGKKAVTKKLEEYFGSIRESSLKALKVGDFEAPLDSTSIVEAREKSKKSDRLGTPKDPCEVLASRAMDPHGPWRLYGRIQIGSMEKQKEDVLRLKKGGYLWSWEDLCNVANGYYMSRFKQEKEKFYFLPHFAETLAALAAQEKSFFNLQKDEVLLRVGHYSHVECITVSSNAPLTRMGKTGPLPHGTTRTLANGVFPFGWVKIRPVDEEQYRRGIDNIRETTRTNLEKRLHSRAEKKAAATTLWEKQQADRLATAAIEQAEREEAEQKRRRQEEEERLYPWRKLLASIQSAADWGQLRQKALDSEEVKAFQAQPEVAAEVKSAAERIRAGNPKKWTEEQRDQLMADWLVPASIAWKPLVSNVEQATSSLSPEETAAIERIKSLKDWGAYLNLNAKINLADLPRPALQVLAERMKKEWKCGEKRADDKKKLALKQINTLLRPPA